VSAAWYVDGGPGPLAFTLTPDAIFAFRASTGEPVGEPLDFSGKELGTYWVQVHELQEKERALVSWWDKDEFRMVSAVFDLATGRELTRGLYGATGSIALPDGDVVSTTTSAMTRSSATLAPETVLPKPVAGANVFESSADGRTLLLTGYGQAAAVYDLPSGTRLGDSIPAGADTLLGAHIAPDGQQIVTNTAEGVLVWDFDVDSMIRAACRMAGRELTPTERTTYFGSLQLKDPCRAAAGGGPNSVEDAQRQ